MHVDNFISLFLIFLPAFLANASPVVAKNIPGIKNLSWPINTIMFGKNKTVRGVVTGILTGIVTGGFIFLFRYNFVQYLPNYTEVYNLYNSLAWSMLFGGILGAGALMGDLIKSFFKRRLGIKPGTMFQPWDGIDYVIGAMIVALPWYNTHFYGIIFLCLIGPALSLLMNTLAYFIGWKERWY